MVGWGFPLFQRSFLFNLLHRWPLGFHKEKPGSEGFLLFRNTCSRMLSLCPRIKSVYHWTYRYATEKTVGVLKSCPLHKMRQWTAYVGELKWNRNHNATVDTDVLYGWMVEYVPAQAGALQSSLCFILAKHRRAKRPMVKGVLMKGHLKMTLH